MRGRHDIIGLLLAIIAAVIGLVVGPIIINLLTGGRASTEVWVAFVLLAAAVIALAAWQFLRDQDLRLEADQGRRSFPARFRSNAIEAIQEYQNTRLDQSLSRLGQVRLSLETDATAVEPPPEVSVRSPRAATSVPTRAVNIEKAFAELGESLVVLGMPGSGKTTMLLHLSRSLLHDARRDAELPLPVVVELTTWGRKKRSRMRFRGDGRPQHPTEWLFGQLQQTYGIGRKVAQSWLASRQLALLFDGLDEMPRADQERCVAWINAMQETWGVPPTVVCCRRREYERLPKLHLQGAVTIRPLTRKLVVKWLDNSPLAGLRSALAADETLWKLLDTPLWFNVMAVVFDEGSSARSLTGTNAEQRRAELLAAYITVGLRRRTTVARYTDDDTLRWLSALAVVIQVSNKAAIRHRRFHWDLYGFKLPPIAQAAVATRLLPSVLSCLAAVFVFTIAVRFGLALGAVVAGLSLIGLLFSTTVALAPRPSAQPSPPKQHLRMAVPLGAVIGTLAGLLGVVSAALVAAAVDAILAAILAVAKSFHAPDTAPFLLKIAWWVFIGLGVMTIAVQRLEMRDKSRTISALLSLAFILQFGLMLVAGSLSLMTFKGTLSSFAPCSLGLMLGLLFSVATVAAWDLSFGSQGDSPPADWRPLRSVALLGLFLLASPLVAAALVGPRPSRILWAAVALAVGIVIGVLAGLSLDSSYRWDLTETIVRPVYSWAGLLPWRLGPFLGYATDRNLLYREGRDYRFLHPLFIEHFARRGRPPAG